MDSGLVEKSGQKIGFAKGYKDRISKMGEEGKEKKGSSLRKTVKSLCRGARAMWGSGEQKKAVSDDSLPAHCTHPPTCTGRGCVEIAPKYLLINFSHPEKEYHHIHLRIIF